MDKPVIRLEIGKNSLETRVFVDDKDISCSVRRIIVECLPTELTKVYLELSPIQSVIKIAEGIEAVKAYLGEFPEDMPLETREKLSKRSCNTVNPVVTD